LWANNFNVSALAILILMPGSFFTREKFCSIMATSVEDLRSPLLWRGVVAEFLGTLFLTMIGCGSCLSHDSADWANYTPTIVQISLTFGLTVATIVLCIGHVSGGHINPAVTVSLLAARKISLIRAVAFIVGQCGGALCGAGILMGITPAELKGTLGLTTLNPTVSVEQGFGIEFMITFLLVLTVFACCDTKRKDLNGSSPLAIGFAVTVCHLFAIKYTGASMNPARTFGPAVLSGRWTNHWVYWWGPIFGGITAAVVYETTFASNASLKKIKNFFLTSKHESSSAYEEVKTRESLDFKESFDCKESLNFKDKQQPLRRLEEEATV
jgi:MIP family channel proteins